MKTMTTLMNMASELYDANKDNLDEYTEYIVSSSLDCGEKGVAVDFMLEWAIKNTVMISGELWVGLRDYYAPSNDDWGLRTKRLIATVQHAA